MIDRIQVAVLLFSKKLIWISSAMLFAFIALMVDPNAIGVAVVAVIGALGGAVVLVINALAKMRIDLAAATEAAKQELLAKQHDIQATVEVVRHATDGMNTAPQAKHAADEDMIAELRAQIVCLLSTADLLAQARVTVDTATAVSSSLHKE